MTSSDQVALVLPFLFLLLHLGHLVADRHPHYLVEHFVQALPRQRTALQVLGAVVLFLDDLAGVFLPDGGLLGVLYLLEVLLAEVDFVADEDLEGIGGGLVEFGQPLRLILFTFLRALTKESGSITEKTMRKTSQWV